MLEVASAIPDDTVVSVRDAAFARAEECVRDSKFVVCGEVQQAFTVTVVQEGFAVKTFFGELLSLWNISNGNVIETAPDQYSFKKNLNASRPYDSPCTVLL